MSASATPEMTLGALAAERPERAQLFERLRLDYCCGGSQTLAEACAQRGLELHAVLAALSALNATAPTDDVENKDWRQAGIGELCEHIVAVHHDGLRKEFPRIDHLLGTVVRVHGAREPRLHQAQALFGVIRSELEPHMASEESELFPACLAWERTGDPVQESLLSEHEDEHAALGAALATLRMLCGDYERAAALCNTHRALLDALEAFEQDLHRHVHEENNVLLPQVRSRRSALPPVVRRGSPSRSVGGPRTGAGAISTCADPYLTPPGCGSRPR